MENTVKMGVHKVMTMVSAKKTLPKILPVLAAMLFLTGCDPNDRTQRTVGGGFIGAGAGAAIGALAGGGTGAAIGALSGGTVGGATGYLTTPDRRDHHPSGNR